MWHGYVLTGREPANNRDQSRSPSKLRLAEAAKCQYPSLPLLCFSLRFPMDHCQRSLWPRIRKHYCIQNCPLTIASIETLMSWIQLLHLRPGSWLHAPPPLLAHHILIGDHHEIHHVWQLRRHLRDPSLNPSIFWTHPSDRCFCWRKTKQVPFLG